MSRGRGRGGRRGTGAGRKRRARGVAAATVARLQMALVVAVLLAAGILVGSFLIEWRQTRLVQPDSGPGFSGTPMGVAPDSLRARIRIEVLNGAGAVGAAKRVAVRLRQLGFDVVYAGNARSFDVARSHLIDRSGRPGAAREVADSVGLDSLSADLAPELHLDATLVLGADWEALLVTHESETETASWLDRMLRRVRD